MLSRTSVAPWLRGALLGALLGTLFLGVGGRVSMRVIATAQDAAIGFSLGGTSTVIFLGALSGLAAGLIYATARKLLPRRVWWARGLFTVILLLVTLRGLRPLDNQRLVLFLPLFLAFGVALDRLWGGERPASRAPDQSASAGAA